MDAVSTNQRFYQVSATGHSLPRPASGFLFQQLHAQGCSIGIKEKMLGELPDYPSLANSVQSEVRVTGVWGKRMNSYCTEGFRRLVTLESWKELRVLRPK